MSKTRQFSGKNWLLMAMFSISGFFGYSQAGTAVFIEVKNMVQTSPSEFQYEVWCTNTGTTALAIRGYSWGLNTAIGLNQSAFLTQNFVSRDAFFTGSAVPPVNPVPSASVTATPAFPSATSAAHLRGTTVNDPGAGLLLSSGVPIRLATMRVNRVTTANGTIANPWTGYNINPFTGLGGTLAPIQVVTASGKTQCVVTMTVTPPGTSYAINGTANSSVAGTLQALTAAMTPSPTGASPFLLNPACTTAVTTPPQNATACNSYTWSQNNATYTASGTYAFTVSPGLPLCDTIQTLNLTINNTTTGSVNASACNTYTWPVNNQTYTSSGAYTTTLTNANSCDSIVTLNLVINTPTSSTTTASAAASYTWAANNVTYTSSGTYTATLTNAGNCDSVATLILTITGAQFTLSLQEDQPISCSGANDGSIQATVTGTGTFTFNIDGGPFNNATGFFANVSAGTHTVCVTDGVSTVCDTISLLQPAPLTLIFAVNDTVTCFGNDGQVSVTISGGTNILQPYQTTWTDISNNVLNLSNNYATAISGLSVGTYFLLVEDDNGCMATGSVALPAYPALVLTASNTAITCASGTSVISASATGGKGNNVITVNGSPLAASYSAGTYTVVATDVAGCTSASVLTITQPSALGSTTTVNTCDSYTWATNNVTYTTSGTYSTTLVNAANCDSVATLALTINYSSVNAPSTVSSCESYTWPVNGVTYTTSGVKTAAYTNQAGCDSSYTLNLTINPTTTVTTNVTAANIYTWPVNGVTYTNSGVYTATSTNSNGCLQTNILNLTVNTVAFTIDVIVDQNISCAGNNDGSIIATAVGTGPFTYILDGGAAINATGIFTNLAPGVHTVCAIAGLAIACDTAEVTSPAPLTATFNTVSLESCLGNDGILEINVSGGTNTLQGYLTWWYAGPVAINWPQPGYTLNDLLTNNFALMMDSLSAGLYTVVVEDDNGCFQTFQGSMQHAPSVNLTATIPPIICFGGTTTITPSATGGYPGSPFTYTINGLPVAASYGPGTYTIVATDTTTCADTLVVTITAPTAPITSTVSVTQCNSYTWSANATTYTASGVYTTTLTAANSCDSIVTLNLTINYASVNTPTTVTACNSYTWPANSVTYTASGTYSAAFLNSVNCDSTVVLNLTINYSSVNAPSNITTCNTYTWAVNGQTYTSSGTYTASFLNTANCDSIHVLNLVINNSSVNTPTTITACDSYTWSANSVTYTASGSYSANFTNAANCDSTVVLNLTINNSSVNAPQSVTQCNTYTWPLNGATYTNSGTYTASYTNLAGCDSSYTLNLTINQTVIGNPVSVTNCGSYTWGANATTYTASGIYTATLTAANSCDSIATLNLTVNPSPNVTSNGPATVCSNAVITLSGGGAVSYSWNPAVPNGVPFVITSSTTYTVTGTGANGCTATSTIAVNVTGGNADIVNTTAGNATSIAGSACQTQNQIDGSTIAYRDANCKMIATIQDPVGGNVFGNVNACAIVYATVPVYNLQPYFARLYTISGSAGPATLTLYLTQDDFNDYNANAGTYPQIPVPASPANGDTAHLCISQVPQTVLPGAPGAQTTVHQVTAVWNAAAARWEMSFPVNGFGGFYFHACTGVALSASVTNFTGHQKPAKDILEWTTSNEQNNAYFNLEYSKDGVNFTTIAKVFTKAPGGVSSVNLNYTAENLKPVAGHNFYRLQQVDIDGRGYYASNIIDLVRQAAENSVSVYPNPFTQQVNIDLYTSKNTDTRIKIMDMSGRVVKQILTRTTEGMNSLNISTSELAAGMYTLQIFEDNQLTHVEKVRKDN